MASAADKLAAVTSVRERPDVHFTLDDVTLVDEQDKQLNWNLTESITSAQVSLTMTGASTVIFTINDEDYVFLNDPVFAKWAFGIEDVSVSSDRVYSTHRITAATDNVRAGMLSDMEWVLGQRPVDLYLDTIAFRLCHILTSKAILTIEFEDRAVSWLRDHKGFKTAERGKITRSQFVALLCNEAGVEYFIPELNVVQPIAVDTQTTSSAATNSGYAGLTTAMGITIKGVPASQPQIDALNIALQTAASLSSPFKAEVALVEALIQENDVSDTGSSAGAQGWLQLLPSTASAMSLNPNDLAAVTNAFLARGFTGQGGAISIAKANRLVAPHDIANAVEGSGLPGLYAQWQDEATTIVNAYHGKGAVFGTVTTPGPYAFTRGPNETSWDCIQRLAAEVGWYAFVRENRLWFVSGNYLFAQAPQLSVARGENGIDWVDVDLDTGARDQIAEVTVMGRTHLWTALPGMTVQVNNRGPANGRWSTNTVDLDLLDESNGCTITLRKPLPARPEPSSNTTTSSSLGSVTGAPGTVQAAIQAAQQLSAMDLPYLWGGGHQAGGLNNVHAGGPGLDCSGSVCWVLKQAGMFTSDSADVSGGLAASWGQPGKGQTMTVWANADHVWIEFNVGGQHTQLNTVSPSGGPQYYTFGPPGGNTAGFTPRHWPGT